MRISRKGNRAAWALLSACFLLALFCSTGSAANVVPDSLQGERVIFGGISGNYRADYYDTSWHTESYTYTGPVIWQAAQTVFGTDDDTAPTAATITLLSEYLLGGNRQYQAAGTSSEWDGSDLQGWLDSNSAAGDFLKEFNLGEYTAIKAQTMPESTTTSGGTAINPVRTANPSKVFILNGREGSNPESELDEFTKIFRNISSVSNNHRVCLDIHFQYPNWYWTRSCGDYTGFAAYVNGSGALYSLGYLVGNPFIAVRPALKLNLTSVIFKSLIRGSDLRNLFGFDLKDAAAGGSNLIQNAYMLFCQAASDTSTANVHLSVNKDKLTVSFDQRAAYAYNHIDPPDANNLKDKFEVTNGGANMVTAADVVDGKIVLTLNKTFASGESVSSLTVQYVDYAPADTYGIGLLNTREYVTSINGGSEIQNAVTNATPNPNPGGGDDGGTTPVTPSPSAKSTDVRSVSVTIDGTAYEGTVSGDKITLNVPAGTDISKLDIAITGYPGATVTPKPPYDFSNGPVKITVKSPDGSTTKTYTITVSVAAPQPVPTTILNALASGCTAKLTQNADGTWGVEILIPFASGFIPEEIETIAAALSGLSNTRFYYVDENGKESEIVTRKAGVKSLRITGTAANRAALSNVVLSSVSIWKKNDATEYKQGMNLKLSDIPGGKPAEEPASGGSSSSGCDAGMAGLAALALAGCVVIGRRRS